MTLGRRLLKSATEERRDGVAGMLFYTTFQTKTARVLIFRSSCGEWERLRGGLALTFKACGG